MPIKRRSSRPLRLKKKAMRKPRMARRPLRRIPIVTNTAAVRENYSVSVADGTMTYFSTTLDQLTFNRAQSVAQSFQEYRIKYVKLTFRPSADTFTPAAGNIIPQLYFQMNKYQALPAGASLQQLLDMGCRPIRFDDKNIVRAYKPIVLLGADNNTGATLATTSVAKVTPWLSTNALAGNPASWAASDIEHLGCVFYVTKLNPATPTINFDVDVEVVFQFRRPLQLGLSPSPYQVLNGTEVVYHDVSGNVVAAHKA